MGIWRRVDGIIEGVIAAGRWLVLPLCVLLFLQWPLRELLRAYSREANDLGQIIFALYVAISVTAATRAGTHLAADAVARHYSERARQWLRQAVAVIGVLPWALFILIASRTLVISSIQSFEKFQDTNNPGYFIIKIALWVMTFLVLAQAVLQIVRYRRPDET